MSLTKQQALEMFRSDDLIGIGMEADSLRRNLHPEGVATYIIDRNINYTNFCTEYCTFCAFYRPLKGPAAKEGYILDFDTIYEKIRETVELGGTGVLMQGGLHPDLKIDWHEKMLRGIKERFPQVHLHCYSASEIIAIAEYSSLSIRDTILRLRDAGLDSIPGGGAEILDDEVRRRRGLQTPHQSSAGTVQFAGRDRRLHRLYPVELSAAKHRSRRPSLGRSHRRRIPQSAGYFAGVSLKL